MRECWFQKEIDELMTVLTKIKDKAELEEFLDLILTPREINDMARRLKIREMLEGGSSYSEIANKLNTSPSLISRVSNKIGFGFRRSSSAIKVSKPEKIDPGKYLRKPVKYKGVRTGLDTK